MPAAHMTRPCENCPYRMDAPRGHWSREEFQKVLESEADYFGTVFACHKQIDLPRSQRGFCAGWLLNQKQRNIPSIALRMVLIRDESAREALEKVSAAGLRMFRSVAAMCRANGVRGRR